MLIPNECCCSATWHCNGILGATNTSWCFGYFHALSIWNVACIQSNLAVVSWIGSCFFFPLLKWINMKYMVYNWVQSILKKLRIIASPEITFQSGWWPLQMNLGWPSVNFWLHKSNCVSFQYSLCNTLLSNKLFYHKNKQTRVRSINQQTQCSASVTVCI